MSGLRYGVPLALERAAALYSAAGDAELRRSFVAWCGGMLSPRLGARLPALMDNMNEETTMLAETLRERDEMKLDEGRRQGRQEGRRQGRSEGRRQGRSEGRREGRREGQREALCSMASQRFGAVIGDELAASLAGVEDAAELARVGRLIIDCGSRQDFLAQAGLRH